MDRAFLEQLGLEVSGSDGIVEAELALTSGQTFNPLTRMAEPRVSPGVL